MKCSKCGCEDIEFSRMEQIGMNATDLLLEKCERQKERIEELERKYAEVEERWSLERWRRNKLGQLLWKMDDLRKELHETEWLPLEQMHKEKAQEQFDHEEDNE